MRFGYPRIMSRKIELYFWTEMDASRCLRTSGSTMSWNTLPRPTNSTRLTREISKRHWKPARSLLQRLSCDLSSPCIDYEKSLRNRDIWFTVINTLLRTESLQLNDLQQARSLTDRRSLIRNNLNSSAFAGRERFATCRPYTRTNSTHSTVRNRDT